MHKATIVYVVMLGVAALLLWGILAIGQHLKPPENVAGTWMPEPAGTGPGTMRVEQSGHFFQIGFEDGHRADVKLVSQTLTGDDLIMKLAGGPWKFYANGHLLTHTLHWVVNGPTTADWTARRPDEHGADAKKGGEK